jgi:HTH-type transcriptional regulator / antitoxin HipB
MEIRTARDLGLLCRDRREQLGWSQAELARRAGTSRKWLSELETGKATIQLDGVLAVLAELGLRWQLLAEERAGRPPGGVEDRGLSPRAPVDLDALLERFVDVPEGGRRP